MAARDELLTRWSARFGADLDSLDPGATFRPSADEDRTVTVDFGEGAEREPVEREFVLGAELARGGMGVVYAAHQGSLRRTVAIKQLLLTPDAGPDTRRAASRSFVEEALVCGYLQHPNIVPVHCLTELDGQLALAMKYVEGRPWSELLAEHPGDVAMHLDILGQLCNAVAFAHDRGVAHNDLKPDNVMVGSFGEVLLMDWGVAVAIGPAALERGLRPARALGGPCGTPCYMAPELAEGRGDEIGAWTDVYLLGAILYHILAGRPPHRGSTFVESVLRAAGGKKDPLPPSVPDELRAICLRAMQPLPADRYPRVEALRRALREHQRHRQSLELCTDAWRRLEEARATPAPREELDGHKLYERYAAAVHGFLQARKLWRENPAALQGELEARRMYTQAALEQSDHALARVQLEHLAELPASASLRRELGASAQRLRRRGWLARGGLWFGLCAVALVGVLGVALLLTRDRAAALAEEVALLREERRAARERAEGRRIAAGRRATWLGLELLAGLPRLPLLGAAPRCWLAARLRPALLGLEAMAPPRLARLAALEREVGRPGRARALYAEALAVGGGAPRERASWLLALARLERGAAAEAALREAWALLGGQPEPVAVAVAYALAGRAPSADSAAAWTARGLALARRAGLGRAVAEGLLAEAREARRRGLPERARGLLAEAVERALAVEAGGLVGAGLRALGELELEAGAPTRARECFTAALDQLGPHPGLERALCERGLAAACRALDSPARADAWLGASLTTLRALRPSAARDVELQRGLRLCAGRAGPARAAALYDEALALVRALEADGRALGRDELLESGARAHRRAGALDEALVLFRERAGRAERALERDPGPARALLAALARVEAGDCAREAGEGTEALEEALAALPDPAVASSWFLQLGHALLQLATAQRLRGDREAAGLVLARLRGLATRALSATAGEAPRALLAAAQVGEAELAWEAGDRPRARAVLADVRANRGHLSAAEAAALDPRIARLEALLGE